MRARTTLAMILMGSALASSVLAAAQPVGDAAVTQTLPHLHLHSSLVSEDALSRVSLRVSPPLRSLSAFDQVGVSRGAPRLLDVHNFDLMAKPSSRAYHIVDESLVLRTQHTSRLRGIADFDALATQ